MYIENTEEEYSAGLESLKEKLLDQTGNRISVHCEILGGPMVDELKRYCEKVRPLAVVMGAESEGAVGRLLFGGETVEALGKLSVPLIIVPPDAKFKEYRRIGLACDLKEVVETLRAPEIKEWVQEFAAEFHIIHINSKFDKPITKKEAVESSWIHELFDDLEPKYHYPHAREVEEGILDWAARLKLDLLIIAPKTREFPDRIFSHSHSRKIALHTEIPVMSFHS